MSQHFHITINESGPNARTRGALCTTRAAAELEARIEAEGSPQRKADFVECSEGCFGQSPLIQRQH